MSSPTLKASILALLLTGTLPQLGLTQTTSGPLQTPIEAQRRLSTAKFSTMLPIATVGASEGLLAELEKSIDPDVTAIVIESGSFTLSDLARAAAEKKLASITEKSSGNVSISAPLVIWKGAELKVGKDEYVLLDASGSSLILNAGTLSVTGAFLEGTASTDPENAFRPFILSVADGGAAVTGSTIQHLGFGSFPETSGLSFLGRGYSLSSASIHVSDNEITDLVSLSLIRSAKSVVTNNRLAAMRSSAIVMQSSANADVRDNTLVASGGHGIRITSQSQDITLLGNTVTGSKSHGIFVDDGSVLVSVSHNRVEKSGLSGVMLKQSGCSSVAGNIIDDNALSGIRAEASFGVRISDNTISKNRDGLTFEGQAGNSPTNILRNIFVRNVAGIRSDALGDLRIADNDFSRQWTRLFAGAIASSTGRYLASQDAVSNSDFLLKSDTSAASVQLASFSAFGLAACNSKV